MRIGAPAATAARARAFRPAVSRSFAAFQNPSFRALWVNSFSFNLLNATQRFTFVWLVLDLGRGAGSAGLIVFALASPVLVLGIPAGVISDRFYRKHLLLATQSTALLFTATGMVLLFAGLMTFPVAIAVALGIGAALALGGPVRAAILPSIVEKDQLMNAITLTSAGMNISWIVGPALGGGMIALFGVKGAFVLQSLLYGSGVIALLRVEVPRMAQTLRAHPAREMADGFRFLVDHRAVGLLVAMAGASNFFFQMHAVLLPKLAKDDLGASAFGASLLYVFMGSGMLAMSLWLASRSTLRHRGRVFLVALVLAGPPFVGIALAPSMLAAGAWFLLWGVFLGLYVNINQTLIQSSTPQHVMGRVMSFYSLGMMGGGTIGGLAAGATASAFGAPFAMAAAGIIVTCIGLVAWVVLPTLRRIN